MARYVDKDALVAEIKKIYNENYKFLPSDLVESVEDFKDDLLIALDTFEVKEEIECKQPEYSYFEITYLYGKKHHWDIGDTLAYYEFCSDREGEHTLGKVTKVDFDKEQRDWFYTFENGSILDEQTLLEIETIRKETYKKN